MLGAALMAFMYAFFWESTGFYDQGNNPVEQTPSIGILFQVTASSLATGIPNLVFLYIAMFSISRGLIFRQRRRNRLGAMLQKPVNAYMASNTQCSSHHTYASVQQQPE